jgi:hypothetical protein
MSTKVNVFAKPAAACSSAPALNSLVKLDCAKPAMPGAAQPITSPFLSFGPIKIVGPVTNIAEKSRMATIA